AEVIYVNLTAYNNGHLQSSFWIVDKQHVYIGSASLDWNSLGQMKELGIIVYNCSCLVLDLQRIFALYNSLKSKSKVPPTWSKRLYAVYGTKNKLPLKLNETKSEVFVSNSPKLLCPKDRTLDTDAIYSVVDNAEEFIYIAVMDYLPIVLAFLDGKIREALILRNIKVRLLISFSKETNPLTFNFISSLKAICTEVSDCSLKVKFFDLESESNFDWVGTYFNQNAGAGLVINHADTGNKTSIIKQLKAVFERDWYSHYAKSSTAKILNCLIYKHSKANQ
ncbi:hypothetical protein E2320_018848, partial [Naja naja]